MRISVREFEALQEPAPVIVHSLDLALYQVSVVIDGAEHLLTSEDGRPLRGRSLQQVREILAPLPVASLVLRQQSAYDEMIGQPAREGDNTLEVPLEKGDGGIIF